MTAEPVFYEITAQVLPVLFLAVFVEYRLFQPHGKHADDRQSTFIRLIWSWVALSFVAAEFICLHAIAFGHVPWVGGTQAVWLAYAYGAVGLVIPVVQSAGNATAALAWKAKLVVLGRFVVIGLVVPFMATLVILISRRAF
jgi:hypothetical protein